MDPQEKYLCFTQRIAYLIPGKYEERSSYNMETMDKVKTISCGFIYTHIPVLIVCLMMHDECLRLFKRNAYKHAFNAKYVVHLDTSSE